MHTGKIKRLVSEKFDKNDLREAVEVGLDLEKEYHSTYSINVNKILNDERVS